MAHSFKPKTPDIILIATGSEVQIAMQCHSELNSVDLGIRVISMPCTSWFDEQSEEYKEEILPDKIRRRIVIEAATSFGWGKYIGLEGGYICSDKFGESGDGSLLLEQFGFSDANCKEKIFEMISKGY